MNIKRRYGSSGGCYQLFRRDRYECVVASGTTCWHTEPTISPDDEGWGEAVDRAKARIDKRLAADKAVRERFRRAKREARKAKRQEFYGSVRLGIYFVAANSFLFGWYLFLSFVEPYSWRHFPYAVAHWLCAFILGFMVERRRQLKKERRINDGDRRDRESDTSSAAERTVGESAPETITIPGARIYTTGGSIPSAHAGGGAGGSASVVSLSTGWAKKDFIGRLLEDDEEDDGEPEPAEELEVYTAPLVGFRSWSAEGAYPTLSGYGEYVWRKGRNEAICRGSRIIESDEHDAPNFHCLCGFHAKKTILDAINYSSGILGGVVGWGKLIEGTDGWRSQYAAVAAIMERPVFLEDVIQANMPLMGSSLPTRAGWLANAYDVPLCNSFEELEAETQKLADWMAGQDLNDA